MFLTRNYLLIIFLLILELIPLTSASAQSSTPCTGIISVQISFDGKYWSPDNTITVSPGKPSRYYLKTTQNGQACSTAFDIYTCNQSAGSSNCANTANWATKSVWGSYRSNSQGVARIDWDAVVGPNWEFYARYKPQNISASWSNQTLVRTGSVNLTDTIDVSPYFIYQPGYTWLYRSQNNVTGGSGITRIQIENEISDNCNNRIFPWRFTKNSPDAYWNPLIPGLRSGVENLRWMVVNPQYNFSTYPSYNNYIWAYGDKKYTFDPSNIIYSMRDIPASVTPNGYVYKSKMTANPPVPAYNLSPKLLPENGVYLLKMENESVYVPQPLNTYCSPKFDTANPPASYSVGSWKLRAQFDELAPWGTVLRYDQFEGGTPLETAGLLRESWYFAKNAGLVKIMVKHFNGYGGLSFALSCKDDSDCLNDTMENPHITINLTEAYQNPTLNIAASGNGVDYSEQVVVNKNTGYYVKIQNTPYTGYLEALDRNNNIIKWLWADKGVAYTGSLSGFPNGDYPLRLRIWIPNDVYPSETRIGSNTIPWSNQIIVTLADTAPSPTPTNTPIPTPTNIPSPTPTNTPTPTPTLTPSPTITPRPTSTPIPTPTNTPVPVPTPTPMGDANGDGKIDTADMINWQNGYKTNLSGVSNGDFDKNGRINGIDYIFWMINFIK